ncbi:MAG: hypothetical protein ACREQN_12035 [Candidatus Binataceae bacterium]
MNSLVNLEGHQLSNVPARGMQRRLALDRRGLAALALYAALSILFFGRSVVPQFRDRYIGGGGDPSALIWFIAWWPHAVAHRLNPFLTDAIWAPDGINLAWTTCVPIASWIAAPLTTWFGPVASYNVLALLAPALAAWTAFILCRYLAGSFWPSILGGYIFGFSSYILGHENGGHINMVMVFLLPLIVYLALLRFDDRVSARSFTIMLIPALVAEFLLSLEIFATMTMFGGLALLLAWSFGGYESRVRIRRMAIPIATAYMVTAAIVSPYLYYLFGHGLGRSPIWGPIAFDADPLNFIIPTVTTELGKISAFRTVAGRFPDISLADTGAYFGLPLILIAVAFAWRRWREPAGKLLVELLIIICVLALGAHLKVYGRIYPIALPWLALLHVPVINSALPVRFAMYADLILAIIAAMWLAQTGFGRLIKIAIAAVIVISLAPNLDAAFWSSPNDTPAFFTTSLYRQYLRPHETVVVLPYGMRGNSMLWQAESGMYFRMAGGYTGRLPTAFAQWPVVKVLLEGAYLPNASGQFDAFLAAHGVTAVIVDDRDQKLYAPFMAGTGMTPLDVGGVQLYRIPPDIRAPYKNVTAIAMEQRAQRDRFDLAVVAAQRYLPGGGDASHLNAAAAKDATLARWFVGPRGLPNWIIERPDPHPQFDGGIWIAPSGSDDIAVGVNGGYAAVSPLIEEYGADAKTIHYPYPKIYSPGDADTYGWLVMIFDRKELADTAARIEASPRWRELIARANPGVSRRAASR